MSLYCGKDNPLFNGAQAASEEQIKTQDCAALSFHSPNMDHSIQKGLKRKALADDQEGIVTLILSGKFIGFVPDHYAQDFVKAGRLRRIENKHFDYICEFSAICKKSPLPPRLSNLFLQELQRLHFNSEQI